MEQLKNLREKLKAAVDKKNAGLAPMALAQYSKNAQPACSGPKIKVRRNLTGHFGKVYAMHWARECAEADGPGGMSANVVSASQDGKLIIWNGLTSNKVQAIPLKSSWVMTCAFEPTQGKLVACGGLDNLCSIFQLAGPNLTPPVTELSAHDGYLSCCRFLSPGKIVTSSGDSTCIVWDIDAVKPITTYQDHGGDVMSVAIHPTNPNIFLSGSCDATARVWDTRTNECTYVFG